MSSENHKNTNRQKKIKFKGFGKRCVTRLKKTCHQIKNDFWLARNLVITAVSIVLAAYALLHTAWEYGVCIISSFVLVIGLAILNISNWFWLREENSQTGFLGQITKEQRRYKLWYRLLYHLLYHLSTVITGVFIVLSILPLLGCDYQINAKITLAWGLVYAVDFVFLQHRWTYRVLPNLFVSASLFVMYALLVSIPFRETAIYKFEIMKDPGRLQIFLNENFTTWLGWGLLGSILTTLIGKATEDVWYGMSRSATGDYAKINYRFKLQRRKLLTYRDGKITRIGMLQISFIVAIPIVGVLLFFFKEGEIRRFLLQIYYVGAALAVMGFLLHQFITDTHLLRAENDYLIDRRQAAVDSWGAIRKAPCGNAAWEWTCYCQVLANVYCSRSPIFHENNLYHGIKLIEAKENDGQKKLCPGRFLSDLIHMYEEQYNLYCGEEASTERQEIELHFADAVCRIIDSSYDDTTVCKWEDEGDFILAFLKHVFKVYFDKCEDLLDGIGAPVQDVKKLLMFDYIKRLVNYEGVSSAEGETCRLAWWCRMLEPLRGKQQRGEILRRLLPCEAAELLMKRWMTDYTRTHIEWNKSLSKRISQSITAYDEAWDPKENYWAQLSSDTNQSIEKRIQSIKDSLQTFAEKKANKETKKE